MPRLLLYNYVLKLWSVSPETEASVPSSDCACLCSISGGEWLRTQVPIRFRDQAAIGAQCFGFNIDRAKIRAAVQFGAIQKIFFSPLPPAG